MKAHEKQLTDPEFKRAMAAAGMPAPLRSLTAHILQSSRECPPAITYPEAFRLSREWLAILEMLRELGCVHRDTAWQRTVPYTTRLRRCPWAAEHPARAKAPAQACGPLLRNNYKGEYRCDECNVRHKYTELIALLKSASEADR